MFKIILAINILLLSIIIIGSVIVFIFGRKKIYLKTKDRLESVLGFCVVMLMFAPLLFLGSLDNNSIYSISAEGKVYYTHVFYINKNSINFVDTVGDNHLISGDYSVEVIR